MGLTGMIRTAEAAARLNMAPTTFRRRFCNSKNPGLPIIECRGPRGGRRILINPADLEMLIESMTVRPAGIRPERGAAVLVQKSTRDGP